MITIDYAMNVAAQLQSEGKLEQAKIILNSILDAEPAHAYALHLSGVIAYQIGKMTLGIQLIQQAINSNSTIALFHTNLGEMHRQLKNIPLSIQYGQRAVSLDPNSAIALSNLGIAFYDSKQYEQAENCHQRALYINPKLACSLNNMGSIYKINGNIPQAIAFYQAAMTASPFFVDPLNNLGVLYLQQQEFKQALECLHRAITLVPSFTDAHCNMGLVLIGLDQCEEALVYFEKALKLTPDYAEAYYGMAKMYLHQYDFLESEKYAHKAIAINPQQVEFYQLLAEIYQEQGKNAESLIYLDHAISIDPSVSSLYISKGNVFMEIGEISKAEDQFLKITDNPDINVRTLAYYCLTQLYQSEVNHSHIKSLLWMADHIQDISPPKQAYVYFALGKCHDDLGEHKKAFTYFQKGCDLKRQRITYHMTEQAHLTHKITNIFTEEKIEYLRTFAHASTLPIFIIGMPRSGTTLVEQIIASHPDVYGAGELAHLNNIIQWPMDLDNIKLHYPENILHLSSDDYRMMTEKYLSYLMHISSDKIRITDKMPNNFIALGLIHALFPNAKIIHVKRNPIDTCLSCYTKLFSKGHYYSYDLEELGKYYLYYEMIMNHWRRILPSHAWLDIHYEDITCHLEEKAKQLIAYCDLTWDPTCLTFYQSKRNIRTASFMQVRQPVYKSSVNRWRHFENELKPLIKILNQAGSQSVAQQHT